MGFASRHGSSTRPTSSELLPKSHVSVPSRTFFTILPPAAAGGCWSYTRSYQISPRPHPRKLVSVPPRPLLPRPFARYTGSARELALRRTRPGEPLDEAASGPPREGELLEWMGTATWASPGATLDPTPHPT